MRGTGHSKTSVSHEIPKASTPPPVKKVFLRTSFRFMFILMSHDPMKSLQENFNSLNLILSNSTLLAAKNFLANKSRKWSSNLQTNFSILITCLLDETLQSWGEVTCQSLGLLEAAKWPSGWGSFGIATKTQGLLTLFFLTLDNEVLLWRWFSWHEGVPPWGVVRWPAYRWTGHYRKQYQVNEV